MKRKIIIFILIVAFIFMAFFLWQILSWQKDNHNTQRLIVEVLDNHTIFNREEDTITIDYEKTPEVNNDIIGWIKIEDTNVDYPVVQGKDNEYYLQHSLDKSKNNAGWIFMDYRNNVDMVDKNTIIYGHGRIDGTMFGSLKNLLESKKQNTIHLSIKNHDYNYAIFSIYHLDAQNDYLQTQFSNDEEYQLFLDNIKKKSLLHFNIEVTANDKIVTLSTCYNTLEKLIIHAKLL